LSDSSDKGVGKHGAPGSLDRVARVPRVNHHLPQTGAGLARGEEEVDLAAADFDRLWPLTEGRRVVKTRYLVPLDGGLTAEVDVYEGGLDGLLTAEVEFADEAAAHAFAAPAWMGEDVTGDKRYANQRLATDGRPG